jgi:hypothetical protein
MIVKVKNFTELKKNHKQAIFLGCGLSIKELTQENIKFINNNMDMWTSNSFLVHEELIPDFYHMEIKAHRNGPLVQRLAKKRSEKYKNVKWIIDQTRPYILNYVTLNDYPQENFHIYSKYYRQEKNGQYRPKEDSVGVSVNASLTVIADIMVRMNYDTIYFLGVDMLDSRYFWTNNKKYEHIEIDDIVKTVKPDERKPDDVHPTYHLKDYLPEFFKYNEQRVVNLASNSALKEVMETKKINEVLK